LWAKCGHDARIKITTTLPTYTHLFPDDDASEDMAALGALPTGPNPSSSSGAHRRYGARSGSPGGGH